MDDGEKAGLVEFSFGTYGVTQPSLEAWKRLFKSILPGDLDIVRDLWEKREEILAGEVGAYKAILPLLVRLPDLAQEALRACLRDEAGEGEESKVGDAVPIDLFVLFKALRDQDIFGPLLDMLGNLSLPGGKETAGE